ncbi:MAG: DegT/DnrJ/EryC1/StrS family aminotransferase [Acidobacteriota bacterium]|nr:DegT/DnrJ/EryC1/StrS family aminotransferase [Acidobacteriota bacterium]
MRHSLIPEIGPALLAHNSESANWEPSEEAVPAIPFARLSAAVESTRPEWEPRLHSLMKRGQFVLGAELASFEREFAAALGARSTVGVASGTDAISLSLRAARIHGEVCTTALTAPFTAIAILAAGLNVRFADIEEDSLQIDPIDLTEKLTPATGGVVAVHLYGQPCRIEEIASITRARGIGLIQDACQAHGALVNGTVPFTAFGDYVAYSFFPTKNLGCLGDGGAVATNQRMVDRRLRLLRDGGCRSGHISWVPGINSRLDEIQACFLRPFLPRLRDWNTERRRLAGIYDEGLHDCAEVRPITRLASSVCHLYIIRVERRNSLRRALLKAGIQTGLPYATPLHLQPAFAHANQKRGSLPRAERASESILSLPLFIGLTESEVWRVVEKIRNFYS